MWLKLTKIQKNITLCDERVWYKSIFKGEFKVFKSYFKKVYKFQQGKFIFFG